MNSRFFSSTLLLFAMIQIFSQHAISQEKAQTVFDAELVSPGGLIEFQIVSNAASDPAQQQEIFLIVGNEKIKVHQGKIDDQKMKIEFPHYDAKLTATFDSQTKQYVGKWSKRRSKEAYDSLVFRAGKSKKSESTVTSAGKSFAGRWQVHFEKSTDRAVGIFAVDDSGRATGTFLTTTGDYRYLGGVADENQLTLSCFDGAHAFLFKATLVDEGNISGMFWSRGSWQEKWTATKDLNASLPDAFDQTTWNRNIPLAKITCRELSGEICTLADKRFLGEKGTIIYLFGTWCPNCHDAGQYLSRLHQKHQQDGISVVGVAFELTGEFERDVEQVKIYLQKHDADFPIVIGGRADLGKAEVSKQFPLVDQIRSYPTTLFVNPDQSVIAIHTGFTGPATGKSYTQLQSKFEALIEQWLQDNSFEDR